MSGLKKSLSIKVINGGGVYLAPESTTISVHKLMKFNWMSYDGQFQVLSRKSSILTDVNIDHNKLYIES